MMPKRANRPKATLDRFIRTLVKLNPAQRRAVETIEGPVMVVAGPGTGKTQVIAWRIANILARTQMNPWNILALTFTEAAAQQMRRRLETTIGQAAWSVSIQTFHSFANEVIQTFPDQFPLIQETEPIDEISRFELFEQILDQAATPNLRPPRAPYRFIKDISQAIATLKRENVAPDKLKKLAAREQSKLKKNPANRYQKGPYQGQLKAQVKRAIEQLNKAKDLAQIYFAYQKKLEGLSSYDFDDMLLVVIAALEKNKTIKAYLQERFQYILVDEFQDTNAAQNRLLELLTDQFDQPNLFVVGDARQSIFRFQGASLSNFLALKRRLPNLQLITLANSYRSHQKILDASQALIQSSQQTISQHLPGLVEKLSSARGPGRLISIQPYPTGQDEIFGVCLTIKKLIAKKVDPDQIAIIYKHNREALDYAQVLEKLKIFFSLDRGESVLANRKIQLLIEIVRAILEPNDSQALFAALHSPAFKIEPLDLMMITSQRPAGQKKDLFGWLFENKALKTRGLKQPDRVDKALDQLAQWHTDQKTKSVAQMIEQILDQSGLISQAMGSKDRLIALNRFDRFLTEARAFTIRHPAGDLKAFLAHLERSIEHGLELKPNPVESTRAAVRLMTGHKAKGQEFETVFIVNLIDRHWGNSRRSNPIKLPTSIATTDQIEGLDNADEDDLRLLFVAITRARKDVKISFSQLGPNGRAQAPSLFIGQLISSKQAKLQPISQTDRANRLLITFQPPDDSASKGFSKFETGFLLELVKTSPITPTGLEAYLRCPRHYFYQNLLRVPSLRQAHQALGTAIHASLEAFFGQEKRLKKAPPLELVLERFDRTLSREPLGLKTKTDLAQEGHQTLKQWYQKFADKAQPALETEYSFTSHCVRLGNIPISGILDKVELINPDERSVRVIDFKTGQARSRRSILGQTKDNDGNYFRQLVFYKLLGDKDARFPYQIIEGSIAFVDRTSRFPIHTFPLTIKQTSQLEVIIQQAYVRMLKLDFGHTEPKNKLPGDCRFCQILI